MSDLTPPPDEPMPDQARARIRADLLAAAQEAPGTRRWLVPVAVAAAVLLIAGVAGWAVQSSGPDEADPPPATAPTTAPTTATSPTTDAWPPRPRCEAELRNPLPGAEQVMQVGDWISFWVKGDRFAVCTESHGRTTIHRPRPMTPAEDASTYAVSTSFFPEKGGLRVVRTAGGLVPDGVERITYRFPSGETVDADFVEDHDGRTWWVLGVDLPAPAGNQMEQPPIEVTVVGRDGTRRFSLDWATDTCAQVNHGC